MYIGLKYIQYRLLHVYIRKWKLIKKMRQKHEYKLYIQIL